MHDDDQSANAAKIHKYNRQIDMHSKPNTVGVYVEFPKLFTSSRLEKCWWQHSQNDRSFFRGRKGEGVQLGGIRGFSSVQFLDFFFSLF